MPAGLFKYFPTDQDKLERFTNGQVYLTPPKYMNDPWDFLLRSEPPTEEQVKNEAPFLHPQDVAAFHNEVSSPSALEDEAREQQEELSRMIGLVCLTESPLDRLMWAHYGESHRGFVAEFGRSDEGKSECGFQLCDSPFGAAVRVDYRPTQPLRKRDGSNMEAVVLTKHSKWKYEQEWRVIRSLKTGAPHPEREGFVLVWFKPAHLLRVILGLRVCKKVRFQLKQMLNHREFDHVRKEEAYIDGSSRALRSRPLPW
jgi:hypothetical protein